MKTLQSWIERGAKTIHDAENGVPEAVRWCMYCNVSTSLAVAGFLVTVFWGWV